MARLLKSKKESIGLSPDALIFTGEQKIENTRIRLIDYNSNQLNEYEFKSIDEAIPIKGSGTTSWLNIDGLHDLQFMDNITREYNFNTLITSKILDTNSRPTFQEYDNSIFISLKMLQYDEQTKVVKAENLALVLKENMLISFQEKVGDVFNPVRERIRKNKKRIRSSGPDYLTFALLDIVIDNYIYALSRLGDDIEELDEELIKSPKSENLGKINVLKCELDFLRKAVKPCRELIMNFLKSDSELISDQLDIHLKELQNNIDLANETVDSYRTILSDQLNIFHTSVAYKLNEILKVLTIFSVIFIPITFIAGIYGTNFDFIPELHFKYSYFIMWGIILLIAGGMITYFKIKKWF